MNTTYTVSKNGYYYKEVEGKKVRIGKAEYESAINREENKTMQNVNTTNNTEKENKTMTNLEKAKKIIKENFEDGCCGLFDCRGTFGDTMEILYRDDELTILICYGWSYFEVFGLTDREFKELSNYYELLKRGVDLDEEEEVETETVTTEDTITEKEKTVMEMNKEYIINAIKEKLGNDLEVTFVDVPKNNVIRKGISVRKPNETIAPNIYYDDLTDDNDIINRVVTVYKVNKTPDFDTENLGNQLMDWDWASTKIMPVLFNTEKSVFPEDIVTMPFTSDIGILFKITIEKYEDGVAAVKVVRNLTEKWGVSDEEILVKAIENISNQLYIKDLNEVMMEMMGMAAFNEMTDGRNVSEVERISVLSNTDKVNGASAVLALSKLIGDGDLRDQDYYIIPSSVHEVLIVNPNAMTPEQLNQMIHEVNTEVVSVEDFLSDYALKYDSASGEFMVA